MHLNLNYPHRELHQGSGFKSLSEIFLDFTSSPYACVGSLSVFVQQSQTMTITLLVPRCECVSARLFVLYWRSSSSPVQQWFWMTSLAGRDINTNLSRGKLDIALNVVRQEVTMCF